MALLTTSDILERVVLTKFKAQVSLCVFIRRWRVTFLRIVNYIFDCSLFSRLFLPNLKRRSLKFQPRIEHEVQACSLTWLVLQMNAESLVPVSQCDWFDSLHSTKPRSIQINNTRRIREPLETMLHRRQGGIAGATSLPQFRPGKVDREARVNVLDSRLMPFADIVPGWGLDESQSIREASLRSVSLTNFDAPVNGHSNAGDRQFFT